jgi:hypothetical protein
MACASRIGAGEDVPIEHACRQLLERQIEQLQVIIGVVGTGVPRSEHAGEHLPPAGRQQRVKAEPALVVPGGLLLLGMHIDRGRVEVEDHPLRRGARVPRPRTSACPGAANPVQLAPLDRAHHPPRGRDRCHVSEQRGLAGDRLKVRHASSAVGEHHRQVAEHPAGIVRRVALPRTRQRVAKPIG